MARSPEAKAAAAPRLWPLGREQLIVLACLGALTALAIGGLLSLARTMDGWALGTAQGAMASMGGMAAEPPVRGGGSYGLLAVMWVVMMVGMMLPSASPMILLYASVQRKASASPLLRTAVFVLGYLLVWSAFALAASGLQTLLSEGALISPEMTLTSRRIAGGVLILAGLYELTPLKHACLRHCRSPLSFITAHWRPGLAGALRMGGQHGLVCIGCCWALMLLLFVGGVMSFACIFALAALVLIQKLLPGGNRAAWLTSLAITALAVLAGAYCLASGQVSPTKAASLSGSPSNRRSASALTSQVTYISRVTSGW